MIYKAIADGNFSTLAIWQTWDGTAWINATVLPSFDDDVYSNNFIVEITSDVFVNSLNRSSVSSPVITQGGQFQITGANDILISGEIYGTNVNQTANNPLSACVNRLATHTGTLSVIGNQNGGSELYTYGFFNNSTFEFTSIVGNQQGGSGGSSYGFYNHVSSTFTSIVGNQQGGSGGSSYGFYNNASSTFTSIVGNQQGGSGGSSLGFYNRASSTFTSIVGNQQGGSGGSSLGFHNSASSTFTSIVGNQQGGSGGSYGFSNSAAGSLITFENSFQKTGTYQGVYNSGDSTTINFINCRAYGNSIYNTTSTTTINFQGITYNDLQNGTMAIKSLGNVNFDLSVFYIGLTPTYTDIALYPASTLENPPAENDVRSGVVYGIGDAYTGTCAIPPSDSVVKNVPVDDTVGEWEFDTDLIERLRHCATTEIVDVQLASYQNT